MVKITGAWFLIIRYFPERMADGPMKLVLHSGKEFLNGFTAQ